MSSQPAVMTLLALCVALPLTACTAVVAAATQPSHTSTDSQEYTLHPGEQITLADHGSLRYVRVANDSRCAPDVQCVWAGDAEVAFAWTPAHGTAQAFSLHTGKDPRQHPIGTREVTLASLARGAAPEATVRVGPALP
jgi:hypothetical protein